MDRGSFSLEVILALFAFKVQALHGMNDYRIQTVTQYCMRRLHTRVCPPLLLPNPGSGSLKVLYPGHVHLARGNHESAGMNKLYGFEGEVRPCILPTHLRPSDGVIRHAS